MLYISLYISTRLAVWSSSDDIDPLLPRFWPRIWVSRFCDGSVTSSILLLFPFKDSHSIPWGDVALRFLPTPSHLPRLRVCPPCDLALLLRFSLFHSALVWLSHLVRFCEVVLLLRLLPDAGNESETFFFQAVRLEKESLGGSFRLPFLGRPYDPLCFFTIGAWSSSLPFPSLTAHHPTA